MVRGKKLYLYESDDVISLECKFQAMVTFGCSGFMFDVVWERNSYLLVEDLVHHD